MDRSLQWFLAVVVVIALAVGGFFIFRQQGISQEQYEQDRQDQQWQDMREAAQKAQEACESQGGTYYAGGVCA